jgi:hypothetical protein
VRVWGAGKNGLALQVDLVSTQPPGRYGDPADEDGSYPCAEDICVVIDHALGNGWNPDARGGTFQLPGDGRNDQLNLDGFRVA